MNYPDAHDRSPCSWDTCCAACRTSFCTWSDCSTTVSVLGFICRSATAKWCLSAVMIVFDNNRVYTCRTMDDCGRYSSNGDVDIWIPKMKMKVNININICITTAWAMNDCDRDTLVGSTSIWTGIFLSAYDRVSRCVSDADACISVWWDTSEYTFENLSKKYLVSNPWECDCCDDSVFWEDAAFG